MPTSDLEGAAVALTTAMCASFISRHDLHDNDADGTSPGKPDWADCRPAVESLALNLREEFPSAGVARDNLQPGPGTLGHGPAEQHTIRVAHVPAVCRFWHEFAIRPRA